MWSMSCTLLYSTPKLCSEDACRYVTQDRLKAMLDYEYLQVSLSMRVSMHLCKMSQVIFMAFTTDSAQSAAMGLVLPEF